MADNTALAPQTTPAIVKQPVTVTEQEQSQYAPMLQGVGTNQLSLIRTAGQELDVNAITGVVTISKGTLKVTVDPQEGIATALTKLFDTSTQKLFDICVMALTQQNHYRGSGEPNTAVVIPLDKYMELRGIPQTKASKDKTRRTVKAELNTLLRTRLDWTESSKKTTRDFLTINICSSAGIKNGNILLGFSRELATYLIWAYVMQYPLSLLRLDERNDNSYLIGKALSRHFGIDNNNRRGTNNIIGVATILEWCEDTIPSYDKVMSETRHVERLIRKPLENALDILVTNGTLTTWEYCNSKKIPLTDEQVNSGTYSDWEALFIHFEVANFPDQTPRLEARTEEAKARATRKTKASKKKDTPKEDNQTD